mmetsp:Transcript_10343/g.23601  ORF Transcript_10343/g.23601 Transcript_10343/m.23601 type:complete len:424 (-) Transcript_10343:240-1511(-)
MPRSLVRASSLPSGGKQPATSSRASAGSRGCNAISTTPPPSLLFCTLWSTTTLSSSSPGRRSRSLDVSLPSSASCGADSSRGCSLSPRQVRSRVNMSAAPGGTDPAGGSRTPNTILTSGASDAFDSQSTPHQWPLVPSPSDSSSTRRSTSSTITTTRPEASSMHSLASLTQAAESSSTDMAKTPPSPKSSLGSIFSAFSSSLAARALALASARAADARVPTSSSAACSAAERPPSSPSPDLAADIARESLVRRSTASSAAVCLRERAMSVCSVRQRCCRRSAAVGDEASTTWWNTRLRPGQAAGLSEGEVASAVSGKANRASTADLPEPRPPTTSMTFGPSTVATKEERSCSTCERPWITSGCRVAAWRCGSTVRCSSDGGVTSGNSELSVSTRNFFACSSNSPRSVTHPGPSCESVGGRAQG